jgi:hypothetical protein
MSGYEDGHANLYGITAKVYENKDDEKGRMEAMADVAKGLLRYYGDKLQTHSKETHTVDIFLNDVGFSSQYVYGWTKDDAKSKYRLVDIDPEYTENSPRPLIQSLTEVVGNMVREVVRYRKAHGKEVRDLYVITRNIQAVLEKMYIQGFLQNEQKELDGLRLVISGVFSDEMQQ